MVAPAGNCGNMKAQSYNGNLLEFFFWWGRGRNDDWRL